MNRLISFLNRTKTRISGYIVAALGALLAAGPQLQQLLTTKQLAIVTVVVGIAVAIIGHYNANQKGQS